MLHIRKEQMEVLDAYMLERFIEKMLVHVHEVFPEETKDKDKQEMRDLVEEGVKRASDYEITEEPQVALFIDLMLGLGRDFEKQTSNTWILRILTKEDFKQQQKMDLIYTRLQG
jgi:hypothetical protein